MSVETPRAGLATRLFGKASEVTAGVIGGTATLFMVPRVNNLGYVDSDNRGEEVMTKIRLHFYRSPSTSYTIPAVQER